MDITGLPTDRLHKFLTVGGFLVFVAIMSWLETNRRAQAEVVAEFETAMQQSKAAEAEMASLVEQRRTASEADRIRLDRWGEQILERHRAAADRLESAKIKAAPLAMSNAGLVSYWLVAFSGLIIGWLNAYRWYRDENRKR